MLLNARKKNTHIGSDGRFRPSGLRLGVTKCQDPSVYNTAPDKTGLMTNLAVYGPEHNLSDSGGCLKVPTPHNGVFGFLCQNIFANQGNCLLEELCQGTTMEVEVRARNRLSLLSRGGGFAPQPTGARAGDVLSVSQF